MNPFLLPLDLLVAPWMSVWVSVWVALAPGADDAPAPEDYKAGWVGFAVIMALVVAVALLGVSLTRHLRKAKDNADHGVFGSDDKPRNGPS